MNTKISRVLAFILAGSVASALEFGGMGNTSAGMGGAGVALKNSAWGTYYNPALASAGKKTRFGYSIGAEIRQRNILNLATIDVNNIKNLAGNLAGAVSGSGLSNSISEALKNLGITRTTRTRRSIPGVSTASIANLQARLEQYLKENGGNTSGLIDKIVDEVGKTGTTIDPKYVNLVKDTVGSIDFSSLKFDGTGAITSITIKKGGNKSLDKAIEDLDLVKNTLGDNALNINSQNGLTFSLSIPSMDEGFGSLSVGLFTSLFSQMQLMADKNRMELIINNGSNYYKIVTNSDGYTYKNTDENDYKAHSVIYSLEQGNAHKVSTSAFALTEIPLSYSKTIYMKSNSISFGINGKIMNGQTFYEELYLGNNMNLNSKVQDMIAMKNLVSSTTFGMDLGLLYTLDTTALSGLSVGVVAKNINSPKFKSQSKTIEVLPQYRAGLGYDLGFLQLAFDADLSQNRTALSSQKVQMIGGGTMFDFGVVDLRMGAMKNIRSAEGAIITGGANLLGVFDLALQVGTDLTKMKGYSVPSYVSLKLGGSLSF